MKTTRSLSVFLTAACILSRSVAADAQAPGAVSKISSVAVYTDRAVVTRTADLNLTPGTREIAFERLPATLLDQSLQVSGAGTAEATILDVTARQTFVEATPNERVKSLEDDIAGIAKQIRIQNDRATTLNDQRDYVKRMLTAATTAAPAPAGGGAASRPTLSEWQGLYSYSDDALNKIATEMQSIDNQKEVLNTKKTALDQQLAQLRGARGKSYKTVVVRVSAAKTGNLQLNIAYTVGNASWTPAYDARLRSTERVVELSYFGVVRQNTGEDWENVSLTLSTARPSLGGGAPELPPWIVDVATPQMLAQANKAFNAQGQLQNFSPAAAPAGGRGGGGGGGRGGGRGGAAAEDLPAVAVFLDAAVDSGATSSTFKIAAPASVPSDASAQKVAVATVKLDSILRYESTPKMREAAYLDATAVNSSDYPLLSGAMNTFLDDAFVATSALRTVMSGEKFELALGADEGIGIKRKLVSRFSEDTGLTSKGKRITYEFLVTVTNHKKTKEQVIFKEPVPVSRDEKIVVKLIAPLERDVGTPDKLKEVTREADGKLVWRLMMNPGEKRDVTVKFSVDYPADLTVSGLE